MTDAEKLILALARDGSLPDDDFYELIRMRGSLNKEERGLLKNEARRKADAVYGKDIYLRGLMIPPHERGDPRLYGPRLCAEFQDFRAAGRGGSSFYG